ncbi:hypothetical protein MPSEU_000842000 [Mayamaea pseudoterrestris]|nr:hypothetical protein MPSEU_000842000 [Mayamaea pseudoterrestris]
MKRHFTHSSMLLTLLLCTMLRIETAQAFHVAAPPNYAACSRPSTACSKASSTSLFMAKDWDAILKQVEEEEEKKNEHAFDADNTQRTTTTSNYFVPPDMEYNARHCQRQQRHYQQMRELADADLLHDVYARDPRDESQVYWFVGKVARVSDVSAVDAMRRQWHLIETHAMNLRPMDLYQARNEMQFWIAPGDSELEVAYNRPNLQLEQVHRGDETDTALFDNISNVMVGFQGEVYEQGEPGFRTWRLPDGSPARPEISGPQEQQLQEAARNMQQQNQPFDAAAAAAAFSASDESHNDEYRAPNDQELEELKAALKDQDIETLWREQQRREGKEIDDDE